MPNFSSKSQFERIKIITSPKYHCTQSFYGADFNFTLEFHTKLWILNFEIFFLKMGNYSRVIYFLQSSEMFTFASNGQVSLNGH